ncbi:hypothetical protein KGQ34_04040 [Patescibacteria group bacterium]|nr:hypothetical protein [Patescibacteria group bacterium]
MSPNDASVWQRLKARLGFIVFVGREMLPGANQTTALYLFKCDHCKQLRIDIAHEKTLETYYRCYECEYQNWK